MGKLKSYWPLALFLAVISQAAVSDDEVVVPTVATGHPITAADKNVTAKLQLSHLSYDIVPGQMVSTVSAGLLCLGSRNYPFGTNTDKEFGAKTSIAFNQTLTNLGYHGTKRDSDFDTSVQSAADFKIGARLLDIKFNVCKYSNQIKGAYYVKIRWELFSESQQKVVYSKVTEGSTKSGDFMDSATFALAPYLHAVSNLFSDADFVAKLNEVNPDAHAVATSSVPLSEYPALAIAGTSSPNGGFSNNVEALQSAVVTIINDKSMGSGFYVSKDGYLLTDAHVVANTRYVKIRKFDKTEVIGEVVRINQPRDIALVKTDPVSIQVIAVEMARPKLGSEVYAIGSPLSATLAGTLTKGIISGFRNYDHFDYVQSDVTINHGSSGGPLLDAFGSAVGIAERFGIHNQSEGLNLFTPIDDALKYVNVQITH